VPEPTSFISRVKAGSLPNAIVQELLQTILSRGCDCRFRAGGVSMAPFIRDGDVLTVSPLRERTVRRGDVVAFLHPTTRRLVVHRVVARLGTRCVVRGDNAPEEDGALQSGDILGRVTRVQRGSRFVALGLGPERCLIALANRRGWLPRLIFPAWRLLRRRLRSWRIL
jgi:signal peptidase I